MSDTHMSTQVLGPRMDRFLSKVSITMWMLSKSLPISLMSNEGSWKWIVDHKLYSHNVRWLIQVPRLYDVYKQNGSIQTFEDIVKSTFCT